MRPLAPDMAVGAGYSRIPVLSLHWLEIDMSTIDTRLAALGIILPQAAAPIAELLPAVLTGDLLVIFGQLCLGPDGKLATQHTASWGRLSQQKMGVKRHGLRDQSCSRRPRQHWLISIGSCIAFASAGSSTARQILPRCRHHERRVRSDGRGARR